MKTSYRLVLSGLILIATFCFSNAATRDFFELRIYQFKTSEQQTRTENYLEKALLPALHRAGIKNVGVFKPLETDSTFGKRLYVLIPFRSLDQLSSQAGNLLKDKTYLTSGKDYLEATFDNPPYDRIQTIILNAFSGMPQLAIPNLKTPASERVYELRSYEGYTEKIYRNKVDMFNAGDEIGLFNRLGFNAVFYAEVLSGARMPNLMYMTTFENQASRDAHWKAFVDDPQWKKLSAMPEYQKNVSHIDISFLRPTQYSDI
ncbi:MAG: NIPSNAP family protein [Cyclobacteriaceae bacterium]|nr:NIPSNAP family protein [Cyclobacteriaceae bacterium]